MAEYDIEGARQSGVPDSDIASALAPRLNYDLEGARKAGVPDKEIADALALKFNTTPGGAATGNPNLRRQGDKAIGSGGSSLEPLIAIGGSTGIGAAMGAAAPEITTAVGRGMNAAGRVIGSIPQTGGAGRFLENSGTMLERYGAPMLRAAGRGATAASGALSGLYGETAGQAAELSGQGPITAEVARIVAGGVSPELSNLAILAVKNKGGLPWVMNKVRESLGKDAVLSDAQQKYVQSEIAMIRGGSEPSNTALTQVGESMTDEGNRLLSGATVNTVRAMNQSAGVGRVSPTGQATQLSDTGAGLRDVINKRYEGELSARDIQFKLNKKGVNDIVNLSENNGKFASQLPEYNALINELKFELDNTTAMKHSPSIQKAYGEIIADLTNAEKFPSDSRLILRGGNLDLETVPGQQKPVAFQALEEVRRKLGESFKGKPDSGYAGIEGALAKGLYHKVSNIQKQFAGGENGPQAKLLSDYAKDIPGIELFTSKMGKKATALDQYREGQYANDASTLPSAYFKSRESVIALKELVDNNAHVNAAAVEYFDTQLVGQDAAGVRKWMSSGTRPEVLDQVPMAKRLVDHYATRLESAERATRSAADFAATASAKAAPLTKSEVPAQKAVDLINSIKNGNTAIWDTVAPAISRSPAAKAQMVDAVNEVVSRQATSKDMLTLFNQNIRTVLEGSGIATKQEMDFIAQRLRNIADKNVPEIEKIGVVRRIIMQSAGGWLASAAGRTAWKLGSEVPQ